MALGFLTGEPAAHAQAEEVALYPAAAASLLRQLAVRTDGRLEVAYLERGPEAWRLQLTRL